MGNELSRVDPPHPGVPRLSAPTLGLMAAIWADLGARTGAAYEKDYRAFAAFLGMGDAEAALETLLAMEAGQANATALAWRAEMHNAGLRPATICRRLSAIKTAVKRARIMGRVSWTLETPAPKAERYRDVRGPGLSGFVRMLAELDRRHDANGTPMVPIFPH